VVSFLTDDHEHPDEPPTLETRNVVVPPVPESPGV
jgi:hypothetical protein